MSKPVSLVLSLVSSATAAFDDDANRALFEKEYAAIKAKYTGDFDTLAVELTAFFLENPGMKTISTPSLIRSLVNRQSTSRAVEAAVNPASGVKPMTTDEINALTERYEDILPTFVKENPDQFHMGRKTGIAINFVHGDHMKDKDGNVLNGPDGEPAQRYRFTAEEWAKATAVKAKADGDKSPDSAKPASGTSETKAA